MRGKSFGGHGKDSLVPLYDVGLAASAVLSVQGRIALLITSDCMCTFTKKEQEKKVWALGLCCRHAIYSLLLALYG